MKLDEVEVIETTILRLIFCNYFILNKVHSVYTYEFIYFINNMSRFSYHFNIIKSIWRFSKRLISNSYYCEDDY